MTLYSDLDIRILLRNFGNDSDFLKIRNDFSPPSINFIKLSYLFNTYKNKIFT